MNVWVDPEKHGGTARDLTMLESRRNRYSEEEAQEATEEHINHANGFAFYQLDRLFRYDDDYSAIDDAWAAAGPDEQKAKWTDTGYVVVSKLTPRGEPRGVWTVFNSLPMNEYTDMRYYSNPDIKRDCC